MTTLMHQVYTMGFDGLSPMIVKGRIDFLDAVLVDIRIAPQPVFLVWQIASLQNYFQQKYFHVPELGVVAINRVRDLPTGIRIVQQLLKRSSVVLMCEHALPDECHRRYVADQLTQALGVENSELVFETPPRPKRVLAAEQPRLL